jgi:osmotically-inducible protein OsmY
MAADGEFGRHGRCGSLTISRKERDMAERYSPHRHGGEEDRGRRSGPDSDWERHGYERGGYAGRGQEGPRSWGEGQGRYPGEHEGPHEGSWQYGSQGSFRDQEKWNSPGLGSRGGYGREGGSQGGFGAWEGGRGQGPGWEGGRGQGTGWQGGAQAGRYGEGYGSGYGSQRGDFRGAELDEGRVQFGRGRGSQGGWGSEGSQGGFQGSGYHGYGSQASDYYGSQGRSQQGGYERGSSERWMGEGFGGPSGQTMDQWRERQSRERQSRKVGSHRWPKSYQRSDERIREDIYERLLQDGYIDCSDVTVNVQQGNVTLEGTVPERHMKHQIENIADDCAGVKDIENRLRVSQGEASQVGTMTSVGSGPQRI